MKAGAQADVFHPYTGWLQFYVDEGWSAEIDTSKLTNWDKVPDNFKAIGQINGKQYFVPWDWGFTSILYNTEKFPGSTSWDALFDPQYDKHIEHVGRRPGRSDVSTYIHGWDETAITDDQLAQRSRMDGAGAAEPYLLGYPRRRLVPLIENGDVWVAYAWQGAYATLLAEGAPGGLRQSEGGPQLVGGRVRHQRQEPNTDAGAASSWMRSWAPRPATTWSTTSTTAARTAR